MSKIESLTSEQEALLPVYAQEGIKIGMSTEPLDFDKAKVAVEMAYKAVDLDPPANFHVADSPMHAIDMISKMDSSQSKNDILNNMCYGFQDIPWLQLYKYLRDKLDIEECHKLDGLIELANHCGWWSPYDTDAILQHRPTAIMTDEEGRAHCDFGPAIEYRDGFGVYVWHGVRFPGDWVEKPETLTPEVALTWENIEQRRVACELLGWNKILDELGYVTIDKDEDPEVGMLVEVDLPDSGKERFLLVQCGTGREFALPIPPARDYLSSDQTDTALAANMWSYGIDDVNDYIVPEVRT